jgi:hypothetical protein
VLFCLFVLVIRTKRVLIEIQKRSYSPIITERTNQPTNQFTGEAHIRRQMIWGAVDKRGQRAAADGMPHSLTGKTWQVQAGQASPTSVSPSNHLASQTLKIGGVVKMPFRQAPGVGLRRGCLHCQLDLTSMQAHPSLMTVSTHCTPPPH